MLNVDKKVVVITGASSGIGEATARLLSQNGANVALGATGRRSSVRLSRKFVIRATQQNLERWMSLIARM